MKNLYRRIPPLLLSVLFVFTFFGCNRDIEDSNSSIETTTETTVESVTEEIEVTGYWHSDNLANQPLDSHPTFTNIHYEVS